MAKYTDCINRAYKEADYILSTRCTIRQAAKYFDTPKSTIHRDLRQHIPFGSSTYLLIDNLMKEHKKDLPRKMANASVISRQNSKKGKSV